MDQVEISFFPLYKFCSSFPLEDMHAFGHEEDRTATYVTAFFGLTKDFILTI